MIFALGLKLVVGAGSSLGRHSPALLAGLESTARNGGGPIPRVCGLPHHELVVIAAAPPQWTLRPPRPPPGEASRAQTTIQGFRV